jgi:uncharacterized protein YjiS (DUF1127 family)
MTKRLKNFASRCFNSMVESQQRRADYWILMNMSNRELHDINVTRAEIRQKVYG